MNPFSNYFSRNLLTATWAMLFLALSSHADDRPTVFLIGDSTVKNGRGDGSGGLWGWGQVVDEHFNRESVRVENRALGGRSSRTYLTEGLWQRVLDDLQPGDFVLMQFGHNDGGKRFEGNRPRASIKGNGDESETGVVEQTGKSETVHSYGWYLRRYIADTRAHGATPIVVSPVPRNIWTKGTVNRASDDYGKWAREAANAANAPFLDLNGIVASLYETKGEKKVRAAYFTEADHTHTTREGALVNAACVARGLRTLDLPSLHTHLNPTRTPVHRYAVPDRVVVLTFDDAVASHAEYAGPLLKKYGFGATFYVCEFNGFENKDHYMTWEQIQALHAMGFEIGNHTLNHTHVNRMTPRQLNAELDTIDARCAALGIPATETFAYPAYVTTPAAVSHLGERFTYSRVGGSRPWDPNVDHPMLVPSYSTTGDDERAARRVLAALEEAKDGKIVVLTLHGVPDTAHPHVNTAPKLFVRYLEFLKENDYTVIAMRDVVKFRVD